MQNGVLPLNEKTEQRRQKHCKSENTTEEQVRKAALKTKGGSGPAALDAKGWRRIYC